MDGVLVLEDWISASVERVKTTKRGPISTDKSVTICS